MTNVISIDGAPVPLAQAEPNEALVAFFEDMLARARAGEIQGFAGGTMGEDCLCSWHAVGLVDAFGMIGALEIVKTRLASGHLT